MTDSITPEGSSEGAADDLSGDLFATDAAETPTNADLPEPQLPDDGYADSVDAAEESKQTVTNDAVAGETVLPDENADRSGRDYGTGDGDEFTEAPSESDTAEPDADVPPGPDAPTDASEPVGPATPSDLRDEDD